VGGQTPVPNRRQWDKDNPQWKEDELEDNPDRRIHWQIFIATLVGLVLLAGVVLGLLQTIRASHREDEISRRARYEACLSIENDATRAVCISRGA
jgi:hypothetical protein